MPHATRIRLQGGTRRRTRQVRRSRPRRASWGGTPWNACYRTREHPASSARALASTSGHPYPDTLRVRWATPAPDDFASPIRGSRSALWSQSGGTTVPMSERRRQAIRERVNRFGGLVVECMGCGRQARHPLDSATRLATKRCSICGAWARPRWWIRKFPGRAHEERAAARNGQYVPL